MTTDDGLHRTNWSGNVTYGAREVARPADVGELQEVVAAAVGEAIQLGAIGFDAVRQIVLARIERRPARLDLAAYPWLPNTAVRSTRAADYAVLLEEQAA